jgi:hypothetical protein
MSATAGSAEFTTRVVSEILSGRGSLEVGEYLLDRSRRLTRIYNVARDRTGMLPVDIALPSSLFELASEVGSDSGLSVGEALEAWLAHGIAYVRLAQCAEDSDDDANVWILQLGEALKERLSEFTTVRVELTRETALYCRALRAAAPTLALLALALPDPPALTISPADGGALEQVHRRPETPNTALFAAQIAAALFPVPAGSAVIDVIIPDRIASLFREIADWCGRDPREIVASTIAAYETSFRETPQEQRSFVRAAELMQRDTTQPASPLSYTTIESVAVSCNFIEISHRAQRWFGISTNVCGGLAALRGVADVVERERRALNVRPSHLM